MAALNLPPLTVRDEALRLYLEALAREIQWIKDNCCDDCGCGGGGSSATSTGTSAGSTGSTQSGTSGVGFGSFHTGTGAYTPPQSIYDLGANTTLSTFELNRTHYINATAAVDVNLPHLEPGQFVVIVNTGSYTITVKDESGSTVTTIASGASGDVEVGPSGTPVTP